MKKVVFVNIDEPAFWLSDYNFSVEVFHSPFLDDDEISKFKERVKADYPNSNLNGENCKYFIEFVELSVDEANERNFKLLCEMMSAEPYRAPFNEEE